MITVDGYSKDSSIQPEGIVITWGKDMIDSKGGLLSFIRYFNKTMDGESSYWLQKCKNKPTYEDILHVYIIVNNRLYGRCFYGGYERGPTEINNGNGYSFSWRTIIEWPRVILAGPFERCHFKRTLRGFQGFRYCTKLF